MAQKKRRLFTNEQKVEVLRIVAQADKPIKQVAQELGIGVSTIHTWIRQSRIDRQGSQTGPLIRGERKELVALRRELKRVEMEREFLKKAATFFARETEDPMS